MASWIVGLGRQDRLICWMGPVGRAVGWRLGCCCAGWAVRKVTDVGLQGRDRLLLLLLLLISMHHGQGLFLCGGPLGLSVLSG